MPLQVEGSSAEGEGERREFKAQEPAARQRAAWRVSDLARGPPVAVSAVSMERTATGLSLVVKVVKPLTSRTGALHSGAATLEGRGPAGVWPHPQARPAVGPQFLSRQRQRQRAPARQLGLDAPPARGAVSTRPPRRRALRNLGALSGIGPGFLPASPSPSAIAVTAGMRPGPPGAAARRRGAGPIAAATARRPWGDPRIRKKKQRAQERPAAPLAATAV